MAGAGAAAGARTVPFAGPVSEAYVVMPPWYRPPRPSCHARHGADNARAPPPPIQKEATVKRAPVMIALATLALALLPVLARAADDKADRAPKADKSDAADKSDQAGQ